VPLAWNTSLRGEQLVAPTGIVGQPACQQPDRAGSRRTHRNQKRSGSNPAKRLAPQGAGEIFLEDILPPSDAVTEEGCEEGRAPDSRGPLKGGSLPNGICCWRLSWGSQRLLPWWASRSAGLHQTRFLVRRPGSRGDGLWDHCSQAAPLEGFSPDPEAS